MGEWRPRTAWLSSRGNDTTGSGRSSRYDPPMTTFMRAGLPATTTAHPLAGHQLVGDMSLPGRHAGQTRRTGTPGRHAGQTRRAGTPGRHDGQTRRADTTGRHTGQTRRAAPKASVQVNHCLVIRARGSVLSGEEDVTGSRVGRSGRSRRRRGRPGWWWRRTPPRGAGPHGWRRRRPGARCSSRASPTPPAPSSRKRGVPPAVRTTRGRSPKSRRDAAS